MVDYEDDQFTFNYPHHTEESVEEEEKRKREWEEEERKMLSTAVTAEVGKLIDRRRPIKTTLTAFNL